MTTETVNPRIVKASEELTKRLQAEYDAPIEEDIWLTQRIHIKKGIVRRVRWTREYEECYS